MNENVKNSEKTMPHANVSGQNEKVNVSLNDSGAVKPNTVKEEIEKMGFKLNNDTKVWGAKVSHADVKKIGELKVGYSVI
jgi:predicted methyltransferase